ncbi:MAG: hypothetical protein Q9195_002230 [Heterodermia aff. obscurata]
MFSSSVRGLCGVLLMLLSVRSVYSVPTSQKLVPVLPPWAADHGHNELYKPTPEHIFPSKKPFTFDAEEHYYEQHHNNEKNGTYKRASCPALNTLANRGFIPRSGRKVKYQEIAQAMREVFNFGDDNVAIVPYANLSHTDRFDRLCWFLSRRFRCIQEPPLSILINSWHVPNKLIFESVFANAYGQDGNVQHSINCPAAPTRLDKDIGNNVDINMTLFKQLLSFSKDGQTFSLEDLAEHHHLRHNQSRAESPRWQFGNADATCALAQYTNLVGVLGRNGRYGLQTLYVEDVRKFYLQEDLPDAYERRELPYYGVEAAELNDRMTHHIGYQITRPFPPWDHNGTDIEPLAAQYERGCDSAELQLDES